MITIKKIVKTLSIMAQYDKMIMDSLMAMIGKTWQVDKLGQLCHMARLIL